MTRRKRNDDVTTKLKQLAAHFVAEMRSREWGRHEFDKMLSDSRKLGEAVNRKERTVTRHVIACIDRVMSIRVAAQCVVTIIVRRRGAPVIQPTVLADVLHAIREQAALAVKDATSATRTSKASGRPRPTAASDESKPYGVVLKATRGLRDAVAAAERAVRVGARSGRPLRVDVVNRMMGSIAALADGVHAIAARQIGSQKR